MNKEQLIGLGLTDEQATKVLDGFKGFVPQARFNEVNDAKKNAESTIAERDKQLAELKENVGNNEALKKQIEELQAKNKSDKEKYDADLKAVQMNNAVDMALRDAGAKNLKAVKALVELSKVKFDGEKLEGLKDQIEALQKDETSAFMFDKTGVTPKGMTPQVGGDPTKPKPYSQMNYEERVAWLEAGNKPE